MGKITISVCLFLACLSPASKAQTNVVPAGTLLRCVMDDINFSPKTAEVGDPVLCHLSDVTEFGHSVFPRGSYLGGRLEDDRDPGHLIGKGYMKIVFDHIGMPNADEQLETKIVAAQGQKVDKQGDVLGHGHAKRDSAEWAIPPLWPWKVLMLPARGPEPKLKTEEVLTLRLMQDIEVPQFTAYASPTSLWHRFGESGPGPQRDFYKPDERNRTADFPTNMLTKSTSSISNQNSMRMTLLALRSEAVYSMTNYWVADRRLDFVLPDGRSESVNLNEIDWTRTQELNAARGVRLRLQTQPL